MKPILFPDRVCSDFEGYSFLLELESNVQSKFKTEIVLDFSRTIWFEANLCAVLGAIINNTQIRLNNVLFTNINNRIQDVFLRNHFLASFYGLVIPDSSNTTIKYRKNRLTEEKLIKEFLFNELVLKQDFPKLSQAAQKEIIRSIFEIYSNAVIHGNTDYVYSCGQFYPNKKPPRIDFTIVDLGISIKRNVGNFLKRPLTGIESIEWAIQAQNTTKLKEDNIPGGLGFKLINDFVKLNKGKVQIVSADGFWEMKGQTIDSKSFHTEFPGTIVNLEFNLDDKSFYYLTNENVEDIIF